RWATWTTRFRGRNQSSKNRPAATRDLRVRWSRHDGRSGARMTHKGRAIYLVYTDLVDDRYEHDFNDWYDTKHVPQLQAIPGILDAARYVAVKGGPKYLAVYELESADVIHSDAFVNRPRTAEDERLAPSAIGKNFARVLGEQIFPDALENTE